MLGEITESIAAYFRQRDEITAVYLFGSYASGSQRHDSDVDLGILFDDECEDFDSFLDRYFVELPRTLRKDIHPLVMNTAGELVLKQIFSKGKVLVVRNPKKLSRFLMIKYSQILDFSYQLNQIKRGFVSHIKDGQ